MTDALTDTTTECFTCTGGDCTIASPITNNEVINPENTNNTATDSDYQQHSYRFRLPTTQSPIPITNNTVTECAAITITDSDG